MYKVQQADCITYININYTETCVQIWLRRLGDTTNKRKETFSCTTKHTHALSIFKAIWNIDCAYMCVATTSNTACEIWTLDRRLHSNNKTFGYGIISDDRLRLSSIYCLVFFSTFFSLSEHSIQFQRQWQSLNSRCRSFCF